ncbi:MAG TPA: SUMF1/EgtB/PvdO family nonheme iron enzyme [Polyangiaceae bacterium]
MSPNETGVTPFELLEQARRRTLSLVADVSEPALRRQFDPAFSPLAWHFGHVAWQEEMWLLRRHAGEPPALPDRDGVFDSFEGRKSERGARLPDRQALFDFARGVRERVARLCEARAGDAEFDRLARFVANHERQHAETMATVRLLGDLTLPSAPRAPRSRPVACAGAGYVTVDATRFPLGSNDDPDGWDNERGEHEVTLPAFELARFPVTAGAWLEFMRAGGYSDLRLWSPEGAAWLVVEKVSAPLYWRRGGDGEWRRRALGGERAVDPTAPVSHVSWYEAEAYSRFAGARLPSEAEWECAASWDARARRKSRWSWGDTPHGERAAWAPAAADVTPVGAHATGRAPCGAEDMIGNVWEWVADVFAPYPGFEPQAYAGYSKPWFDGNHRVLRGGSYLTEPPIARSCFRNWYEPWMRQPPTGVRLARGL